MSYFPSQMLTRFAAAGKSIPMNPTWLIANWKMNGDAASVRVWAAAVNEALGQSSNSMRALAAVVSAALGQGGRRVIGVFCPPAIYLAEAKRALPHNAQLKLGAQACHGEPSGAFTGEISAAMLKDAGCEYVIVGHSERRAAGESDAQVLASSKAALAAGLTPVICVGESRAAYEAKLTKEVLSAQLSTLKELPAERLLIAYEPIWAIGSDRTPEAVEIEAAHTHIKSVLGSGVNVLYGGSVKAENIGKILGIAAVSGALIGGASLGVDSMRALIAGANKEGK